MITYERYAELLSKIIRRTIADPELAEVAKYEAAQGSPPQLAKDKQQLFAFD